MDLNTPALRRQIIIALGGTGEWHRKVKGYQLRLVRSGKDVGWMVALPRTRRIEGWAASGSATTVFDALIEMESVIERRVARTDT